VPIAFNPNTGLIYASTWNVPRLQKLAMPKPILPGKDSTGGSLVFTGKLTGEFKALDQDTGKTLGSLRPDQASIRRRSHTRIVDASM
jgi:hypothetical protein